MTPQYFDFHSHIHFDRFAEDREAVLERMRELGVWTIVVGTDQKHSEEALAFAKKHDGVFATVGLHPADNKHEWFDESNYSEMVSDPNVVMVGECGLDYYHVKEKDEQARQRGEFEKQIDFAAENDKPMMLHVRNPKSSGGARAHEDALDLLSSKKKEYGEKLRGNTHFFTEGPDIAKRYYELGFTTSFPGVITFTHDYDEAVKYAPKEMIISETDSPYAAPVPHRGKRNEPAFVVEVVKKIAELRGEDLETMKKQLVSNALRVIGWRR